jgi:O-antigen ligase
MQNRFSRISLLDLPIALFLLSAVVGVIPAYDRSLTWGPLAVMLACGVGYFIVSRLAANERNIFHIVGLGVMFGGLIGVYFITQFPHYAQLEKVEFISQFSQAIGRIFPSIPVWTPGANSIATFLEGIFFVAIGLFLAKPGFRWRIGAGISAGMMGLAIMISESRGAWLAIFLAGMGWLALHYHRLRWVVYSLAVGLAGLVIFTVIQGDINALSRIPIVDRTLAPLLVRPDRLDVYRGSLYLIQDTPFTGIGLGSQFAMNYSNYVLLIQVPYLFYSHNLYLEIWLEQGLIGIAAWVWLMAGVYYAAWKVGQVENNLLYEGTWIGLTAVFLHGITDANMYIEWWIWASVFLLLGINNYYLLGKTTETSLRSLIPAEAAIGFVAAVLVSIPSLPAAWQANIGSLRQAQADLQPGLSDNQRTDLRKMIMNDFESSIQIAPGLRPANARLGIFMLGEDRYQDAVEYLEVAYKADPTNTGVIKSLGMAYVWTGEVENAARLLKQVPQIVAELNYWGWWRNSIDQDDLAKNAYQVSLLLKPDQDDVRASMNCLGK